RAAPSQLHALSLHDALPISDLASFRTRWLGREVARDQRGRSRARLRRDRARVLVRERRPRRDMARARGVPAHLLAALLVFSRRADRKSTRLNSSHGSISYAV